MIYFILYPLVSLGLLYLFSLYRSGLKNRDLLFTFLLSLLFAPLAGLVSALMRMEFIQYSTQSYFDLQLNNFLLYFFIVAPVEEMSKFFAFLLIALRLKKVEHSMDIILLGLASAIGFAAIENILYLQKFGMHATLPRLILGNMGHTAYSLFWSYPMAVILTEDAGPGLLGSGLILAILMHGLYNLLLSFSWTGVSLALLFSLILYYLLIRFLWLEKNRNRRQVKNTKRSR